MKKTLLGLIVVSAMTTSALAQMPIASPARPGVQSHVLFLDSNRNGRLNVGEPFLVKSAFDATAPRLQGLGKDQHLKLVIWRDLQIADRNGDGFLSAKEARGAGLRWVRLASGGQVALGAWAVGVPTKPGLGKKAFGGPYGVSLAPP